MEQLQLLIDVLTNFFMDVHHGNTMYFFDIPWSTMIYELIIIQYYCIHQRFPCYMLSLQYLLLVKKKRNKVAVVLMTLMD